MLVTTSGRDRAECPPSHPKRRRIRRAEGRGGGKGEGGGVVVGQRGHLDNPRRRVRIQTVQPLGRACAQLGLSRRARLAGGPRLVQAAVGEVDGVGAAVVLDE